MTDDPDRSDDDRRRHLRTFRTAGNRPFLVLADEQPESPEDAAAEVEGPSGATD